MYRWKMNEVSLYTGEEKLRLKGKELPHSMLEFWRLSLSNIQFSMNRGTFAEYIVRCALKDGGFDSTDEENGSIREYDITEPVIPSLSRTSRIEVKSVASINSENPQKDMLGPLSDSKLVFGLKHNKNSSFIDKNDLYVFCHYKALTTEQNILDLDLWDFYVYPTFMIENDEKLRKQRGISIYRLKKLGVAPKSFEELYQEIKIQIGSISDYMSQRS